MKKIEELIKYEIKEVVGCTEPASIAFAFSNAIRVFQTKFGEIDLNNIQGELKVSDEVYRNASTVKVPVLKMKGILPAAVAGLFSTTSTFNPFAGIDSSKKRKMKTLLKNKKWLKIEKTNKKGVFVEAKITYGKNSVKVLIEGFHDKIKEISVNGKKVFKAGKERKVTLTGLEEIYQIAKKRNAGIEKAVEDFINRQGLLYERFKYRNSLEAVKGAIEKRMEGESIEVQTLTGSGNQGIFVALPFYEIYKKEGKKVLPAAVFSVLTQIYLTQKRGRISGICGLSNKSAPSLIAGLTYYKKRNLNKIKQMMNLAEEALRGLACEGAKKSCALKAFICLSLVYRILSDEKIYDGIKGFN